MKRGRLSNYEMQFIKDNSHLVDYMHIAKSLDRKPESIKEYMEEKLGMTISLALDSAPVSLESIKYDIETEEFWPVIQQQFSKEELIIFRYQWSSIYDQFGGDVLPTEKLQIIDIIKLEVLMNRNLIDQKKSADNVRNLELEIIQEKSKGDEVDKVRLSSLERQLGFLYTAQTSLGKDYRDLQDKKDKLFKSVKGTRDQRYSKIEESRETFLKWITQIIENPRKRKELGMRMEKMRLATIDEEVRLAAYHKYEDGNIDQPLLNCDTVKDDNGRLNAWEETKQVVEDAQG